MASEDIHIYTAALRAPQAFLHVDPETIAWRGGLVLRTTNWLGDALMSLPATWHMSRRVSGGGRTVVLCPAFLAPLWQAAPWIDEVISLSAKRCRGDARRHLRSLDAGVALVLPNSFGSALDVFGVGIPVRVGRSGRGRSCLLTHRLPAWRRGPGMASHPQLSHYLDLASVFGSFEADGECPSLRVDSPVETAAALGVAAASGPWLVVAPGAAYGPAKQWPVERFSAVARWWRQTHGPVLVVGTAKERAAAEALRGVVPDAVTLAGETDLRQLMALLRVATLVLANDSGAMHLGGALGCRGVAVFGSTDPVATGPIGGCWVLLHDPPRCAPCFERSCKRDDEPYQCLRRIHAEQVIEALEHVLAKEPSRHTGQAPGNGTDAEQKESDHALR